MTTAADPAVTVRLQRPVVRPSTAPRLSWGRWPRAAHSGVVDVDWSGTPPDLAVLDGPLLAFGLGRSYGDVCLNEGGLLLDTRRMSRILDFDAERGQLLCEAGTSLAAILDLIVPRGWFLPVLPGTKYVTVGGAIANDVHGKNHHRSGTFGSHVTGLQLLRSDRQACWCSPTENSELFAATIGGLGLTGLILTAEIQLIRVPSSFIEVDRIRYGNIREFFALADESDETHEYTVAWVDGFATGAGLGRGVFIRGNHAPESTDGAASRRPALRIPLEAPSFALAPPLMRLFNQLYYMAAPRASLRQLVHYEQFFFPLDAIEDWNLLYGRRGFTQYQCVLPAPDGEELATEVLKRVARSGSASFLAVLKRFGSVPSPGLLSFPREGVTLALDMPLRGASTFALCEQLDALVAEAGGAVYPAKDSRMSAQSFRAFFPQIPRFGASTDPRFSSSFWRRMTG